VARTILFSSEEIPVRFGVSIWPFHWQPPYDDGIRRIAALGYRQVELIAWTAEALDAYYTPTGIAGVLRVLEDCGVAVSAFITTPRGIASPDAVRRARGVDQLWQAVDVAAALGAPMMNSVVATPFDLPFPGMLELPISQEVKVALPPGLDWQRGYDDYVASLRACCALCEQAGLRYALETHPYRWATTAMSMLRLIEHVGSPILGVNLDPSHLFPCGELPQVAVYQLGDRVFHCHFSDNDGHSNAHWRPGKGKVDWRATLVALRDVGFDGVVSLELEGAPGSASGHQPVATAALDVEYSEGRAYLSRLAKEEGIVLE
jgi:sugar phosphate isomerase/epimerase